MDGFSDILDTVLGRESKYDERKINRWKKNCKQV